MATHKKPNDPREPLPIPAVTLTLGGGYGFYRVQVWVAPDYPRVTRDNHYLQLVVLFYYQLMI